MNIITYKEELIRKLIHLTSLWIPISYLYCSTAVMLKILFPLMIIAIAIDCVRKFSSKINGLVNKLLGKIMRQDERESTSFSGATYLLMSSVLTIAFFEKEIAIFALTILMISDSCAALIGRRFGRIKIIGKTVEGSFSFILSALLIYFYFVSCWEFELHFKISLVAILVGSITELFAKKLCLDDNFAIPIAISLALTLA